jgi:hypothetical protein
MATVVTNEQLAPMNPTKIAPVLATMNRNNEGDQSKRQKRRSVRRSGTMAIHRMQSEGLGEKANDPNVIRHKKTTNEIITNDLAKAKKSGIVSTRTIAGMAAFKKSNLLDDPFSVVHQSLAIQSEFRFKIMFTFIGQMCLMYAVMLLCLFTPSINSIIVNDTENPGVRLLLIIA